MSIRFLYAFLSVTALVFTIGCTSNDNPPTIPVSGSVTLDGKTVSDAVVTFIPGAGGQSASGKTDASGKFVLGSFVGGDGAMKGTYDVTVSKIHTEAGESMYDQAGKVPEAKSEGKQSLDDMYANASKGYSGPPKDAGKVKNPAVKNDLPKKYDAVATSGLKFEVVDKCPPFNIELKSK